MIKPQTCAEIAPIPRELTSNLFLAKEFCKEPSVPKFGS